MRECKFLIADPEGKPTSKKGRFHQWGHIAYGYEDNGIMQTVAIVEDETGQVHVILPKYIQFVNESV